ncbi:MAG: hypothetical protein R2939_17320 [Kofleriaceae bacterium]
MATKADVSTSLRGLALVALIALTGACGNKSEVRRARASLYDADFASVYNAAVAAVRESYPDFDEDATTGKIRTAWRQVQFTTQSDDPRARGADPTLQSGTGTGLSTTEALGSKRYFARFDVTVAGERPWRVRVVGHASEWASGNAEPTTLRGAATPSWLPGREDALVVAIYRRLKEYAVPAPEVGVDRPVDEPAPDPSQFPDVAPAAATMLANLRAAAERRDYVGVRAALADDVVWSAGAAPGADGAMVILQADAGLLDRLIVALDAGCAGPDVIECGAEGPRVTVTLVGTSWLVTALTLGR